MAKRAAARGGRAAKPAAGRQTKSKKTTAVVEVEVVEESGGSGIDAGIAVMTSILLLVAILFVDAHLARYGKGMFF
jgi:hypothetical protein